MENTLAGTTISIVTNGIGKLHAEASVGNSLIRFFVVDGDGNARWTISDTNVDWGDAIAAVAACAARLVGHDVRFVSGPDADADVDGNRWVVVASSQL